MSDSSNFFNNPLATMILLMAAYTPDPVEKINSLNSAINSMREAIQQINTGLETFNTKVMPMFIRHKPEKNKSIARTIKR